jgi:hypothetical protein
MKQTLEKIWFQPYTPFVILLIFGAFIFYGIYPLFQKAILPYNPGNPSLTITPSPTASVLSAQAEATLLSQTLEKVGKLMLLPGDETPKLIQIDAATIKQLQEQPFFKNARVGNVLLVYNKNKKAILYDPQFNQIIDVAPINPPEEEVSPQPQEQTELPGPSPVASTSGSPTPSTTISPTP